MRITTGDLARALKEDFPPATDDMVRAWCEEGHIDYWKNPFGKRYFLKPQSIKEFLVAHFSMDEKAILRIGAILRVNFNQIFLTFPF